MDFKLVRRNNGTIVWSEDQLKFIISEYKKGTSLSALGKDFNVHYGSIRQLLRRNGVTTLGNKQGYPRNEHYFSSVNQPEKAYWLGFLYADGCVHKNSNEISLTLKDGEHLEKFKQAIGAVNHTVGSYIDNRWESKPRMYTFSIKDRQLQTDLIALGCVPAKSLILNSFPNIPRDFVSHFLRGYFDGDGSIHWLNGTNNFRLSFVGTKEFLLEIKKELNLNMTISQNSGNKSFYLQIAGRQQVPRVLDYLYKDSEESTRLNRKYALYQECLLWAHRH